MRVVLALILHLAEAQDVFSPARQLRGSANASNAAPEETLAKNTTLPNASFEASVETAAPCVTAPQLVNPKFQSCCDGATPYPANPSGYYCKAIVLGSAPCVTAPELVNPKFQSCCDGATPYPANPSGYYCKAIVLGSAPCVTAPEQVNLKFQSCCDGAMPYHANGGTYCKAMEPACVEAPQQIHDGQTCCEGAVRVPDDPYHPSEGYYCKAIVLGSAPCVTAPEQINLKFQSCCDGAMPYHANGGTYCKAMEPACVKAGDDLHDGQTCCEGAMPYHATGGSYCKAIVLREDAEVNASEESAGRNSTGMMEAVANLFCASIGEDCGPHSLGGLHWRKRCCGSARCQKFVGSPDGAMKCVEEHPVQPAQHCVAFNGECGGPGRQTQPCCIVGFSCKKENFFSAVMKCMA